MGNRVNPADKVNHPTHYNMGRFEVIDVIEDWALGFNLGNAIKYIGRCEHKDGKLQDLQKAAWYLNREIEALRRNAGIKKEPGVRATRRPPNKMTFDDFQRASSRTSQTGPTRERLLIRALGLSGEAAEVGQILKKWARQGPEAPLDVEALADELSDLLWYIADLSSLCGLRLEEVAAHNIDKLRRRYPEGFTADGGVR